MPAPQIVTGYGAVRDKYSWDDSPFPSPGLRAMYWAEVLLGPYPGKWTRGFNHDAIVSVANPAVSKAFGER